MQLHRTGRLRRSRRTGMSTASSASRRGGRRVARNAAIAAVAGVGLAASSAAPAQAAPEWAVGTSEQSTVVNCTSAIIGEPYTQPGVLAYAGWLVDRNRLPRVGEVFYVSAIVGAVGAPCVEQSLLMTEVVLPRGVQLAISSDNPVRCVYEEAGRETAVSAAQGCPQAAQNGAYGHSLNRTGSLGPVWALPLGPLLRIEVPVRSSRPLRGSGAPLPSCDRRSQLGQPCPPEEAGDAVQFGLHVSDGNANPWLSPYIPLFVVEGDGGSPPDGSPGANAGTLSRSIIASVPTTIRIARLRRGVPIGVRVQHPRSRIKVSLVVRGRTVASASIARAPAGTRAVRVKATAAGARLLRRLRRPSVATLRVRVSPPSGAPATAAARIRVVP